MKYLVKLLLLKDVPLIIVKKELYFQVILNQFNLTIEYFKFILIL